MIQETVVSASVSIDGTFYINGVKTYPIIGPDRNGQDRLLIQWLQREYAVTQQVLTGLLALDFPIEAIKRLTNKQNELQDRIWALIDRSGEERMPEDSPCSE